MEDDTGDDDDTANDDTDSGDDKLPPGVSCDDLNPAPVEFEPTRELSRPRTSCSRRTAGC